MRVGIIDTGLQRGQWQRLHGGQAFVLGDEVVLLRPLGQDHVGRGTPVTALLSEQAPHAALVMAQVVVARPATPAAQVGAGPAWWLEQARQAQLLMGQVFGERPATTAAQVGAGLAWLLEQGVSLINFSLGLHADRPMLRELCCQAAEQGVLICASSPAMGQPVYPAAYSGVVAVTGDARCQPGQWSWLQEERAEFGAPVGRGAEGGASMACARFSGMLAAFWTERPSLSGAEVLHYFRQHAIR